MSAGVVIDGELSMQIDGRGQNSLSANLEFAELGDGTCLAWGSVAASAAPFGALADWNVCSAGRRTQHAGRVRSPDPLGATPNNAAGAFAIGAYLEIRYRWTA